LPNPDSYKKFDEIVCEPYVKIEQIGTSTKISSFPVISYSLSISNSKIIFYNSLFLVLKNNNFSFNKIVSLYLFISSSRF
jgi:hypothetical protein